mmetsp:Transcript_69276/g.109420  ORF Transcript_69276/g.109420 Transcript_69276/m.109420 type:complete len:212 (-) Transcript_69276:1339-1974(-)
MCQLPHGISATNLQTEDLMSCANVVDATRAEKLLHVTGILTGKRNAFSSFDFFYGGNMTNLVPRLPLLKHDQGSVEFGTHLLQVLVRKRACCIFVRFHWVFNKKGTTRVLSRTSFLRRLNGHVWGHTDTTTLLNRYARCAIIELQPICKETLQKCHQICHRNILRIGYVKTRVHARPKPESAHCICRAIWNWEKPDGLQKECSHQSPRETV